MTAKTVGVFYKYVDGAHFFTAKDGFGKGVCAASTDLKTAFDEVAVQLAVLAKENHGEDMQFEPGSSFEAFQQWLDAQQGVVPVASIETLAAADWLYNQAA